MNHTCEYASATDDTDKCSHKPQYGCYCYKHRRLYLLENDEIRRDRYTGLAKDYLRSDLQKYAYTYVKRDSKVFTLKKPEVFALVDRFLRCLEAYSNHVKQITRVQAWCRGRHQRSLISARQCNNSEDFFTFEEVSKIDPLYYYSYEDTQGFRWGFDVRSLHRLNQLLYPNPYTTEKIPPEIIGDVTRTMALLEKNPKFEPILDHVVRDRETAIKQRVVDLFSLIEQSGYTCHVEWFLTLSLLRLKELYKQLEDLWNYRAQLTHTMKRLICPPDGRMFQLSPAIIMSYDSKPDIQEIILGEVWKFREANEANMKLGFMYFMIGFGYVSRDCYIAHQDWLNFVGN